MNEMQELCRIATDLIETLQLQAGELERVVTHLEQQTIRLEPPCQLPMVVSDLSALHGRMKKLAAWCASAELAPEARS